jgi:Fe(3+) dicitrate transport protein
MAIFCLLTNDLMANEAVSSETVIDNVTIIGHRQRPADVPGSAHIIDSDELSLLLQSDVMRVLRTVPGVYLQEEEGFGLRPNIGIRGSGLDRSARIALLEDGVLIAPAPYAAPSAYYFPTQRRMHSVEVLKGPASIAVGPRTTGGAVNLVSTPIPDAFAGGLDLRVGQNNSLDALINVGNRGERFSWLVETVQARNDGFKTIDVPVGTDRQPSGFDIRDYMLKLQYDSAPSSALYQSLRLKAGFTDQVSDETYLGLTDEDFAANPMRRYAASSGDQFVSDHRQLQLSYVVQPESGWSATITAYRNDFNRNWFKLQSVQGAGIGDILDDTATYASEFSYLRGASSPDDAIVKRHNNRSYLSQGVQAAVTWNLGFGETDLDVTAGIRIHEDEEDRLQKEDGFRMNDLLLELTSTGAPGSQTNRVSTANARSAFVDTSFHTGRWTFTPGVRFENIELVRNDYTKSDPQRLQGPTRVRSNTVNVTIPGIGALYELNDNWRLLAGVHKGFNPPAPGSSASEESSVNLEAGARYNNDLLSIEGIVFVNEYDNLVGTVTESTGGGGEIGDQFDGGEVTVRGLELSANAGWDNIGGSGISMPLSLRYTWTAKANFNNSFKSNYGPWGEVQAGDELPYIPEHQLRAAASVDAQEWTATIAANYVGQMRTVAGQGEFVQAESLRSHVVWDALGSWRINDTVSAYLKVDNLLDEVYMAARRPAGARPGLDRTGYAGVTLSF